MTDDSLLVLRCLFATIYRLFTSWYIPGTNVTPAMAFFGILFLSLVFRFVADFLMVFQPMGSSGKPHDNGTPMGMFQDKLPPRKD